MSFFSSMADSVMRRLDTWVGVPVENDRQPDSQATAMSEDDEFEDSIPAMPRLRGYGKRKRDDDDGVAESSGRLSALSFDDSMDNGSRMGTSPPSPVPMIATQTTKEVAQAFYRVIGVEGDAREALLVERVMLQNAEVCRLCTDANPTSVSDDQQRIDFRKLNEIAGTFQGFYGPRAALVQYLASNQFPDEGLQFLRSCSAGIYAWVRPSPSDESKISVDLVLWPTEDDWSAVSSVKSMRDLMTNLLRYLWELSGTLVCLLDEDTVQTLEVGAPTASTQAPVWETFQVEQTASVDRRCVPHPGFDIVLGESGKKESIQLASPSPTFSFSRSHSVRRKVDMIEEVEEVAIVEVPKLCNRWQLKYSISFAPGMVLGERVELLRLWVPEDFASWNQLDDVLHAQIKDLKKRKRLAKQLVSADLSVRDIFESAFQEFMERTVNLIYHGRMQATSLDTEFSDSSNFQALQVFSQALDWGEFEEALSMNEEVAITALAFDTVASECGCIPQYPDGMTTQQAAWSFSSAEAFLDEYTAGDGIFSVFSRFGNKPPRTSVQTLISKLRESDRGLEIRCSEARDLLLGRSDTCFAGYLDFVEKYQSDQLQNEIVACEEQRAEVFSSFVASVLQDLSGGKPALQIVAFKPLPRSQCRFVFKADSTKDCVQQQLDFVRLLPSRMEVRALEQADIPEFTPLTPSLITQNTVSLPALGPKLVFHQTLTTGTVSGRTLAMYETSPTRYDLYLFGAHSAPDPRSARCVHSFRRQLSAPNTGAVVVAYDELLRLFVVYGPHEGVIAVYKFDPEYRCLQQRGQQHHLDGIIEGVLTSCFVVPGRHLLILCTDREVLLYDEAKKSPSPSRLILNSDRDVVSKCLLSPHGDLFCIVEAHRPVAGTSDVRSPSRRRVDIPFLTYCISHESPPCFELIEERGAGLSDFNVWQCQLSLAQIGPQLHLVSINKRDGRILSKLLDVCTGVNATQLRSVSTEQPDAEEQRPLSRCNMIIEMMAEVFSKYAVESHLGPTPPPKAWHIVNLGAASMSDALVKVALASLKQLQRANKPVLKVVVPSAIDCHMGVPGVSFNAPTQYLGQWVVQAICLIPIQLARASNNELQVLRDGLPHPELLRNPARVRSIDDLAENIRFGLYDAVLGHFALPTIVCSSMGNQSTGKSYMLNHIGRTFFDVSGGRCTDGVWMSVRITDDQMFVFLDFEGLGSFERTEQEDMLLSVLNAALSNVTMFKVHSQFDRHFEQTLGRLGLGATKSDAWRDADGIRLFSGALAIILMDVENSQVEEVKAEFKGHFSRRVLQRDGGFLEKLYNNRLMIIPQRQFGSEDFYNDLQKLAASVVSKAQPSFMTGTSFATTAKALLAKLDFLDWSPVDGNAMRRLARRLHQSCCNAVYHGVDSQQASGLFTPLHVMPGEAVIDDNAKFVFTVKLPAAGKNGLRCMYEVLPSEADADGDQQLQICMEEFQDAGCALGPMATLTTSSQIPLTPEQCLPALERLRDTFAVRVLPVMPESPLVWHRAFQAFLDAVVQRRQQRVLEWYKRNIQAVSGSDNSRAGELFVDLEVKLQELASVWRLCVDGGLSTYTCAHCCLPCLQLVSHTGDHDCLGSHVCTHRCEYCEVSVIPHRCQLPAGHPGAHHCTDKEHNCREPCDLSRSSVGCKGSCHLPPGHQGSHVCLAAVHYCKETCEICREPCRHAHDEPHGRHECTQVNCPSKCQLCDNPCAEAHFHAIDKDTPHLCSSSHRCADLCSVEGLCGVESERVYEKREFESVQGKLEYSFATIQNPVRKPCHVVLAPGQWKHDGPHMCDSSAVHSCPVACPACGYFCALPFGHAGRHKTQHGNMRKAVFVAQGKNESIDVDQASNRVYRTGDSAVAEMCDMYCSAMGRGHFHLIDCQGVCRSGRQDVRHSDQAYHLPDGVVARKDEVQHQAYFELINFEDPCPQHHAEFHSCPYICSHASHESDERPSFCKLPLWHSPVSMQDVEYASSTTHHVSQSGHVFGCTHSFNPVAIHTYFIIDRSGSMCLQEVQPSLPFVAVRHNTAFGAVLECLHRYICQRTAVSSQDKVTLVSFNTSAQVVFDAKPASQDLIRSPAVLGVQPDGGTQFSEGLGLAAERLRQHRQTQSAEVANSRPILILLTDGDDHRRRVTLNMLQEMMQSESHRYPDCRCWAEGATDCQAAAHRLVLHAIGFGECDDKFLEQLATLGHGSYQRTTEQLIALTKAFSNIAERPVRQGVSTAAPYVPSPEKKARHA